MWQGVRGAQATLWGWHQVRLGRDPKAGLGAHKARHALGDQSGMGTAIMQTLPSQNPTYQIRMVMMRTAASTKKAKIPRDTRMAIFSRESLWSGREGLSQPRDAAGGPCCKFLGIPDTHRHGARDPSHNCLWAVPTPAHHLQFYSLMGSGLGAWEGSSARLSRLASIVVSSLAAVAGSGSTEGMQITHPKSWVAPQGPTKMSKGCPCAPGVPQA